MSRWAEGRQSVDQLPTACGRIISQIRHIKVSRENVGLSLIVSHQLFENFDAIRVSAIDLFTNLDGALAVFQRCLRFATHQENVCNQSRGLRQPHRVLDISWIRRKEALSNCQSLLVTLSRAGCVSEVCRI